MIEVSLQQQIVHLEAKSVEIATDSKKSKLFFLEVFRPHAN